MPKPPVVPAGLSRALRGPLLRWFRRHRRALPWRGRRTAYRVWLSELMLQQTRVDQALPYFQRFLRRFPTLRALARASFDEVLKAWEGLGYYRRARHAHAAARLIVGRHGGRFPRTHAGLRALPGVGPYTAAAVGSLAFGLDEPVWDGNVARVMARLTACRRPLREAAVRARLQALVRACLPVGRAGLYNEALMELGALCCTPRAPTCPRCPVRAVCAAAAEGRPERYPVRAPRRARPHKVVGAGVIWRSSGEVLIAQRKAESMLGGLWEFPGGTREPGETLPQCIARELREELGLRVRVGRHLVTVRHAYTHFTIELHAYWARITGGRPRAIHCAAYAWARPEALGAYAFSAADLRIIAALAGQPLGGAAGP